MILAMSENTLDEVTELAISLWPDCNFVEEKENFNRILHSETEKVFIWKADNGQVKAFIYLALRHYAEGAITSPVGYIEGIYVDTPFRNSGVGQALVHEGEGWCRKQGCIEMASDVELDNFISHQFHLTMGYSEICRTVCYLKNLLT